MLLAVALRLLYSTDMNYRTYLPLAILGGIIVFFLYDIISDIADAHSSLSHVLVEAIACLAILLILFSELKKVHTLEYDIHHEKQKTARLSGELSSVINKQFVDWQLSPSEQDIALLLIKGMSMKEISALRNVKEKTVRQQATRIYAKSGYTGRHELAAHFIEDLLQERADG